MGIGTVADRGPPKTLEMVHTHKFGFAGGSFFRRARRCCKGGMREGEIS